MIVLVFLSAYGVLAHNWVNTLSRSPQANTVAPTLPSGTGQPHVQVIAGQPFQIEWQQGHGKPSYFILVSENNADKLSEHKDLKNLEAYLNHKDADKTPPTGQWAKYHRTGSNVNKQGDKMNYFDKMIPKDDALYIVRDDVFDGKIRGVNDYTKAGIFQWKYPSSCTKDDRRTFHKDSDRPWILGMWKFQICVHEPARPDVSLFNVPASTKPGNYLLHYRWQGYYDVIDVEVMPGKKAIAKPYGIKPDPSNLPPPVFQRIPHCEFKNPIFTGNCVRVVSTEETCIRRCARQLPGQCGGVNVVSLVNPTSVPAELRDQVNIPFDTGMDARCKKSKLLDKASEADARKQRFKVCYSVVPAPRTDISTDYYVTQDPDDPAFYSTCHVRVPPVLREGPPKPPPPMRRDSIFNHKCIACDWLGRNLRSDVTQIWMPRYNRCIDCAKLDKAGNLPVKLDYEYLPYTNATPPARLLKEKTSCDGINGNWREFTNPCTVEQSPNGNCVGRIRHYGGSLEHDMILWDALMLMKLRYNKKGTCDGTGQFILERDQSIKPDSPRTARCPRGLDCCGGCKRRTANGNNLMKYDP